MDPFNIVEHKVPCQHVRDFPRALLHEQEDVLHLAVKQYIPIDNPNPQPGDVTIIGAHANGFPKELYEPLWEDLHAKSKKHNFRIRSIWIADVAHQGESGVLNEELIGNDPGWNDHPRDLLHFINLYRHQMPRPIIGIGHSMGGNNLVNLAYIHPRLLTTLVLIDPVVQLYSSTPKHLGPNPAQLSTFRRDVWPSREAAATAFKKSKFYQAWDPRVLDRWIKYGLRDMPTPTHPVDPYSSGPSQVTLTTTKHQEVFMFLRPNFDAVGVDGNPENRKTHPDFDYDYMNVMDRPNRPNFKPVKDDVYPFYRAEGRQAFFRLPELRPSVLYVFGGKSDVGTPEACKMKMQWTGVGNGGSGGAKAGRVKSVTYEDIGHLIAMEAVGRTADSSAEWIGNEMKRWREDEEEFAKSWKSKPRLERQMVDDRWKEMIGGPPGRPKKAEPKL